MRFLADMAMFVLADLHHGHGLMVCCHNEIIQSGVQSRVKGRRKIKTLISGVATINLLSESDLSVALWSF
jgi:hypothetical protein